MKPTLLYLVLGSLLLGADEPAPRPQIVVPAKVIAVGDGDTVTVELTLRANLRLLDCWAPETNKPAEKVRGLKSKAKLEAIAAGKTGLVTIPLGENLSKSISLGRLLGRLTIDGKDVSDEMVKSGFATKNKEK
jgi:endonuclease YncB( thermonuclease family)